jgi:hypothetical protein
VTIFHIMLLLGALAYAASIPVGIVSIDADGPKYTILLRWYFWLLGTGMVLLFVSSFFLNGGPQ